MKSFRQCGQTKLTTANRVVVVVICVLIAVISARLLSLALVHAEAYSGPSALRGIVDPEGFTARGVKAFVVPAVLGGFCYLLATIGARFVSPVPIHIYIARVALMLVFIFAWWAYYTQALVFIWSGSPERYTGPRPKSIGTLYGAHTIWAWYVVALVSYPRKKNFRTSSHSNSTQ